jgi:hypothetical protein
LNLPARIFWNNNLPNLRLALDFIMTERDERNSLSMTEQKKDEEDDFTKVTFTRICKEFVELRDNPPMEGLFVALEDPSQDIPQNLGLMKMPEYANTEEMQKWREAQRHWKISLLGPRGTGRSLFSQGYHSSRRGESVSPRASQN